MVPNTTYKFDLIKVKSNAEIFAYWHVPADLVYLNGHFPEQPVVPAVALIDAAVEVLRHALGRQAKLAFVKNAKFTSPLLPRQTVIFHGTLIAGGDWSLDLKVESPEGHSQAVAKLLLTVN